MMRTIEELKTTKAEKFIQGLELAEFIEITKSIDLDRLSEICNAERERIGMESAGQPTDEATSKLAKWRSIQRNFIKQTGLKRQYARE